MAREGGGARRDRYAGPPPPQSQRAAVPPGPTRSAPSPRARRHRAAVAWVKGRLAEGRGRGAPRACAQPRDLCGSRVSSAGRQRQRGQGVCPLSRGSFEIASPPPPAPPSSFLSAHARCRPRNGPLGIQPPAGAQGTGRKALAQSPPFHPAAIAPPRTGAGGAARLARPGRWGRGGNMGTVCRDEAETHLKPPQTPPVFCPRHVHLHREDR
ncbi:forkhead box protein L2-like [Sturnira hondurensis]|uniref:forkhead box protein L2-like n=1 Tax=Sturnira hondurensis TaxID=192404 RepID=UPI0018791C1B|nr:forkhead box protein L2-like [Sturnira hondurensis]